MYTSQADSVKEWLQAYQHGEKELEDMEDRLLTLRSRMTGVPAQELSDMPRPPSSPKDRMTEYVIQIDMLERAIQHQKELQKKCRDSIMDVTENLRKPEARDLIRYRYLDGYEWADIMQKLYGRQKDLNQRENAYRRKMYRLHQSALKELARIWTKPQAPQSPS